MKELFKTIIRDWQKAKIVRALQVCLTSQDEVTRQRELRGIVQTAQRFGLAEGYIITLDAEEALEMEGVKIVVQPCWKWLLADT